MFNPFDSSSEPALAPMTNADLDACAWLMSSAGARKHGRAVETGTRAAAAQHLAGLLAAPHVRAFVWRDARCVPVAFVAGELHTDCFQVTTLCVSRQAQGDGLGLRIVQQVQRALGVGQVELADSLTAQRARQILKAL